MLNVKEDRIEKRKKHNLVELCLGEIKAACHPLLLHQAHRVIYQTVYLPQLALIEVLRVVQCTKPKRKKVSRILSAS